MHGSDRPTVYVGRAAGVLSERLGDETVLMHPDGVRFVRLNVTAARLWELLEASIAVTELEARLAARWRLPAERARADVDAFVSALQSRGMVELTRSGGGW
jgi:hypothetical protein